MNLKFLFLVPLVTVTSLIQGLTFNIVIADKANIDIFVTKEPPTNNPFTNQANTLVEYSFLIVGSDDVFLWQHRHQKGGDWLTRPLYHFAIPEHRTRSFMLEITPSELEELGSDNQVYVTIQQRMYEYNTSMHAIIPYRNGTLTASFYALTAVINLEAEGIIAPEKFALVPVQLRTIYPEAHGSVS